MHRIATAMLIAAAVLVLNAGMLRDAFARDTAMQLPAARTDIVQPIEVRTSRLLSLLLVLESLRQAPIATNRQKV